jgi:hypothetical protein
MTSQEQPRGKDINTDTELDRLASSMFLLTLDPNRALSIVTQEEGSGSPILSLDYSSRFAFVLHHVLGYRIEDAAAFAKLSEEEFCWLLRDAYTQLAASCEFYSADFVAAPALA